MIRDLDLVAPDRDFGRYDICIAGAGVAGIVLALALSGRGRRVALLEAGGLDYADDTQAPYRGAVIGRDYPALESCRLRYLGGTSNHWSGLCRPLEDWDFAPHDHIALSGWPIARSDLDPYLARAADILEIESGFDDTPLAGAEAEFAHVAYRRSPPVRLGEKYFATLRDAPGVDLFLHASVVGAGFDEARGRVLALHAASDVEPGRHRRFDADDVVLALGGIENPRLMLALRRQVPGAFEPVADWIGRCFMEHPHLYVGHYVTEAEAWPFTADATHLATTPAFRDSARLAAAQVRPGPLIGPPGGVVGDLKQRYVCADDAVREFIARFHDIHCRIPAYVGGTLRLVSEQVPNRDSRVFLGDEVDRYGLPRAVLDWRLSALDHATGVGTVMAFARYLAARRLGNVKLDPALVDHEPGRLPDGEVAGDSIGYHHMGTTRMAAAPSAGVVDGDGRVFGTENLYVAGSSVFATGGHGVPTLTIVQLALRLADRLAGRSRT